MGFDIPALDARYPYPPDRQGAAGEPCAPQVALFLSLNHFHCTRYQG